MSQLQTQGPTVAVKPQPNVYTVLVIIGIVVLGVAIGVMLHNLTVNYDMTMGQIFDPSFKGPPVK